MRRVRLNSSDTWLNDELSDQLIDNTTQISDDEYNDSLQDVRDTLNDMGRVCSMIYKHRHEKYSTRSVSDETVNKAIELVQQFQQIFTDFMSDVDALDEAILKLESDIRK